MTNIKVNLIAHTADPEAVVAAAINQCYSQKTGVELKEKLSPEKRQRLIKTVISSGHTSTIEHATFTFSIEGISRVTEVQLVRHRIASYSIKSGRYNPSHTDFVIPPKIEDDPKAMEKVKTLKTYLGKLIEEFKDLGYEYEDIRYFTPQGTKTNLIMTMNARALFNFFQERLCNRAQWEIRTLAKLMFKECKKIAPNIFRFAGPTCVTEKICWQGNMHCGKLDKDKSIELREKCV